jgi:hypothetical protein
MISLSRKKLIFSRVLEAIRKNTALLYSFDPYHPNANWENNNLVRHMLAKLLIEYKIVSTNEIFGTYATVNDNHSFLYYYRKWEKAVQKKGYKQRFDIKEQLVLSSLKYSGYNLEDK